MTVRIYLGPWDNPNSPPPAGTNPDWYDPHDPHEDNVAIVWSKSSRILTINQIVVRNHGDETIYNLVDVYLYAKAFGTKLPDPDAAATSTMDGQTPMDFPANGVIPGRPYKWELAWENRTVPCNSLTSPDQVLTVLGNGQVIQWSVPPGYTNVCLVVAISCTEIGQYPHQLPSRDPCIAIRRTSIP